MFIKRRTTEPQSASVRKAIRAQSWLTKQQRLLKLSPPAAVAQTYASTTQTNGRLSKKTAQNHTYLIEV